MVYGIQYVEIVGFDLVDTFNAYLFCKLAQDTLLPQK